MTILGLDPGTARIGWGVIDDRGITPSAKAYGLITTPKEDLPESRLKTVFEAVTGIIAKYRPETVSIEELFFSKNVTTAIAVGQARGVLMLACANAGVPVVSYSPLTVKRSLCGTGTAEKRQVQFMVAKLLRLASPPQPDDVADALAIAITHAFTRSMKGKIA
jgi:crossover junction endodeoxyribonuclease RuvC